MGSTVAPQTAAVITAGLPQPSRQNGGSGVSDTFKPTIPIQSASSHSLVTTAAGAAAA